MLALAGIGASSVACKKNKVAPAPAPADRDLAGSIKNYFIPSELTVSPNTEHSFTGEGFLMGDRIQFTPAASTSAGFTAVLKSVNTDSCSFLIPAQIIPGAYVIEILRGKQRLTLGTTTVILAFNNIPDQAGMTVKGTVFALGRGLANVVVSDGVEVTQTDATGIFYLPSKKEKRFLFVSLPGGYEAPVRETVLPVFYKEFTTNRHQVETIDFELRPVNNHQHLILALGDMHLANRNNDISQFQNGFLQDAATTIKKYQNEGYKVYGLTLGDMTWDAYWYENGFGFRQYIEALKNINIPVFHTMGNHDNDPYISGDWPAENSFRAALGPTYYSFNLGKIHYIVLDNIQYINTDGAQGQIGERNYKGLVVPDQIAWLQKDLATITNKSTPIIVAMHIQLNNNPTLSGGVETSTLRLNNAQELMDAFSGFSDVHLLTGHTHICYAVENSHNLMEHNSGAVCATWWWTGKNGYAGNHICKDGAPGGYAIWKFNNRAYQWLYKSIGYEEPYQFRAYDLNQVHITAAKYAPKATDWDLATYAGPYAMPNSQNEILINVWGYDKTWKVEVFENGAPLSVSRVRALDPLHIISYEALRLNNNATPTADFVTTPTAHLFLARASSANSPVEIKVTDRFGAVYSQTMNRPKELTVSML